jgi:hypothetical protein
MPAGLEPLFCRVIDRRCDGPAGLPSLLILDRRWDAVADCVEAATHGASAVGFLGRPGDADGPPADLAVVRCLHYRPRAAPPRRVLAAVDLADGPLRLVLEPASRIDAWPLRATLLEDPYRAARIAGGGHVVHRVAGQVAAAGRLPAQLRLGTLRVWGYAAGDDLAVPVGFFLEPDFDPRAIASVVLWRPSRPGSAAVTPSPRGPRMQVAALSMPGGRRLQLLTGGGSAALGAAVVAGEHRLVGTVESAGPGDAMVNVFGTDRRRWSFVLVPRSEGLAPIDCSGRAVARRGLAVELEFDATPVPVAGDLLTGGNGRHAPAGLWVGELRPLGTEGRRALLVQRPFHCGELSVCRAAEDPR